MWGNVVLQTQVCGPQMPAKFRINADVRVVVYRDRKLIQGTGGMGGWMVEQMGSVDDQSGGRAGPVQGVAG